MIQTIRAAAGAVLVLGLAMIAIVSPANAISSSTDCWHMENVGLVCVNVLIMDDGTAYYSGAVMR